MYDTGMYNWVNKVVGLEKVLKLVKRMSKIEITRLDYGEDKEYNVLFMTTFFKILITLKGDREMECISYFKERSKNKGHCISITDGCLSFVYVFLKY